MISTIYSLKVDCLKRKQKKMRDVIIISLIQHKNSENFHPLVRPLDKSVVNILFSYLDCFDAKCPSQPFSVKSGQFLASLG